METPAIVVLRLPLLHVALLLLERLLVAIDAHACPVGYFLLVCRLAFRMLVVERRFGVVHAIVKREGIDEWTMRGVQLLLILNVQSRHLHCINLLCSHFRGLHCASVKGGLDLGERLIEHLHIFVFPGFIVSMSFALCSTIMSDLNS